MVVLSTLIVADNALAQDEASPSDLVQFGDDDRLTGEVRGLDRGKLSFNTGSTGTIAIEWDDVTRVESTQRFELWTTNGARYVGTLVAPVRPGTVAIDSGAEVTTLELAEVVEFAEIEQEVLQGLDVGLSLGYAFSKASDITQLTFGWDVSHRRERRVAAANFDADASSSSNTQPSRRINLDTRFIRYQPERKIWGGLGFFEQNTELDLDLRSSVGAAKGRVLRSTNSSRIEVLGGLVYTKENVASALPEEDDTTIEGIMAFDLEWFRFDTPELDATTRFVLFPSLSDTGSFRTNLDVDFRWEIIGDLFLGLSLYHTHDSAPSSGSTQNDYGVTTSLGWEF